MQFTTKTLLLLAASLAAATASTNPHEYPRQPPQPSHQHSYRHGPVRTNETAGLVSPNVSDSNNQRDSHIGHEHHHACGCGGHEQAGESVLAGPTENRLVPMPSKTGGALSTGGVKPTPTPFVFLGAGSGRSGVEVKVALMAGAVGAVWVLL